MRVLKKAVKYLLWLVVLLLIVFSVTGYYLLNTTSGLKRAVELANDYSGYTVSADSIQGKLLHKTQLKNLQISGNGLTFQSDSVLLDWQSNELFEQSVAVKSITIADATLSLPAAEKTEKSSEPFQLNDIKLPFDIQLEELLVTNLTIKNPVTNGETTPTASKANENEATQTGDIVIDKFQLGIEYVGQVGKIHTLIFQGLGAEVSMTGEVTTKGDYPIELATTTNYHDANYGNQVLQASIHGALKKAVNVDVTGTGLTTFSLAGEVSALFSQPQFTADLSVKSIDSEKLALPEATASADLAVSGAVGSPLSITAKGDVHYDSPQTDKLKLNLDTHFDGTLLEVADLSVDLLTAKQTLTGKGQYQVDNQTLDIQLSSPALHWPQSATMPTVAAKNLALSLKGTLDNYQLQLTADTETDVTGKLPIELVAKGNSQAMQDFTLNAALNNQPLSISGKAAWQPNIGYDVQVIADKIAPFRQFPGVKNLNLQVTGDDKQYQANGNVSVYADNIPPSDVALSVAGSPTALEKAELLLETLGGTLGVSGSGSLSPLDLQGTLSAKHIQPQRFYPQVEANMSGEISVTAKQNNDNLIATAVIEQLSGKLQQYPLSGKGKLTFEQTSNQLDIDDLAVDLAGNKILADGQLALDGENGQSNITANIDAKYLKRLLPDLAGALVADIVAKGNLSSPEITAKIDGKNLAYQQHKAKQVSANALVSLASDKVNIIADVAGIDSAGTAVDKAKLTVVGKISAHTLSADIAVPKKSTLPALTLTGKGGFDTQVLAWSGVLNQLTLSQEQAGRWTLPKPAKLTVSAANAAVGNLCLTQKTAAICADGAMKSQNGAFDVTIKGLKTQQFAKLLPKTLKIDTTIGGKATVKLAAGKPTVTGQFSAQGGKFAMRAGSGALTSKIQQFETNIALKNNRFETTVASQFSKLGKVNVEAALPNISQPNIRATIKIDSENLSFLEELVPQISDVRGKLDGDMTLSGDPAKQLNIAGKITLQKTDFNVPQFGSEIRDLTLDIFAKNGNTFGFKGSAKAGGGDFVIDGELNPTNQRGQIDLKGKNFQVANSKKLKVAISPDLQILFAENIQIRGEVVVPKALIVPKSTGSKITASEDVVMPKNKPQKTATSSPIDAGIRITLGDDVRVASADIETRLHGGIKVLAKPGKAPSAAGVIEVETGELRIYGQLLNIERGRVIFSHGPIANPTLDIRTSRTVEAEEEVIVGANVLGTAKRPEISLFSTPSMPDSSILSYLLFGRPPNSDSFGSTALLQTGGLVGANALARDIRSSVGLDVLDFSLTGFEAGKNLSKKMYVGMKSNFFEAINQFLIEYKLNSKLRLKGSVSGEEISGDLIRVIETD